MRLRAEHAAIALPLAGLLLLVLACRSPELSVRGLRATTLPERGVSAHRGAAATHPENTLAAFREAVRLGAHQIELDVRRTSDDRLVVIHDATLDRTTNGQGRVGDRTLAEIRRLDAGAWKATQFAGERVPTFEEALEVMPRNVWLNVHVKGDPWVARRAAEILVDVRRTHQAMMAVDEAGAAASRAVAPGLWVCDMDRKLTRGAYLAHAAETRAEFIQFTSHRGLPGAAVVDRARAAGLRANFCCTSDPDRVRALLESGVRFPLVDDLAAGLRAAAQLGIDPWVPAP